VKKLFIISIYLLCSISTFGANKKQWVYSKIGGEKIPLIWKDLGNHEVIVAVIDTGVDTEHEDLKSQLWVNQVEKDGEPGVDDDNNGYIDDIHGFNFVENKAKQIDVHGHGTHVAGVIAAAHNGIGIRGVNPNARIMALKAFGGQSSDVKYSIDAIYYAVNNGAKIINCSWVEDKKSPELEKAVNYAHSKGVIIIGAAGNTSNKNRRDLNRIFKYLAEFDNVIIVANHTRKGWDFAERSQYGSKKVDLAAPGEGILSTVPDNKYKLKSGTSMATPFVSGAVSLLFSLGYDLTLEEIRSRLYRTGEKERRFKRKLKSGKRINVYNFVMDIAL
jgi:subtilisin family serine protease